MNNVKKRSSNIELLRILLIIMVIFLHFSNREMGGGLNYVVGNSINEGIVRFLQGISICAVDTFIIITGFFMCKKKEIDLTKPIILLISVVIFQLITYILLVIFRFENFSLASVLIKLVPLNWYIMLYNVLYFMIPVLNKVLDKFNVNKNKIYIIILFTIFSIYPSLIDIVKGIFNIGDVPGLSTISILGNEHGYTIINFILLYFIGALIKKSMYTNKIILMLFFFISSLLITALSYFTEAVWNYNNVFIIINAVCLFKIFINLNVSYNKLINFISRSVLGIYIVHPYLIKPITKFVSLINIGNISPIGLFSKIGLFIIIVFMASFIIYLVSSFFINFIKLILFKVINYSNINTKIEIR
ncbi:acyltransferase family protein [Thomasclavelia ramosa]|uniref:acyltransferase family protein n=1 Tax=Thomasclavelia ramosa TaxID=1547 RepID=UPI0032C1E98D